MNSHKYAMLIFGALVCVTSSAFATPTATEQNVDTLAEELVKLRSQVEELNTELEAKKSQYKSRMAVLANQRAELDASLKRESLAIKQQLQSIEKNKQLIKELGTDSKDLKPTLFDAIATTRQYVKSTLPFKRSERLNELEKIREQLSTDVIDAEKAANRLWAFVEDEIRLTKENGIYRQTITIKDNEILADVAKLGMIFMYFQTPDEQYGYVKHDNGDYRYQMITDNAQKKQVATLFDSLRKQIRQGFFELPNVSLNIAQ